MGAILASETINRAQITLLDDASLAGGGSSTWNSTDPDELLKFYNASVRLVCLYKPDVYVTTSDETLVAGARQNVAGSVFIGVKSNADGMAVTQVDMDDFDHCRRNWRNDPAGATVHWMADRKQPNTYWVWPPAVAGDQVEIIVVDTPPEVAENDANPLPDVYEQVLYWLVLAHAYSKNAKRGDLSKSASYLTLSAQGLGLKGQIQLTQSPSAVAAEQRST